MKKLTYIIMLSSFFVLAVTSCQPQKVEAAATTKLEESSEKSTEMSKPVLIHTVFFWTKEGTTPEQKTAFEAGLVKLGTCPQIQSFYWGPPAPTEARGVVDNTYDYAINVHFESIENQNEYQKEPIHLAFIEDHKDLWEKVIVYDNAIQ